jgi:hypothetical protein
LQNFFSRVIILLPDIQLSRSVLRSSQGFSFAENSVIILVKYSFGFVYSLLPIEVPIALRHSDPFSPQGFSYAWIWGKIRFR